MISKKKLVEVALPSDAINAAAQEALPYNEWVVARSDVGRLAVEKVREMPGQCRAG